MILALLLLFGCGERRDLTNVLTLEGDTARGEAQYQMACARCHGAEGNGVASTPALKGYVGDLHDPAVVQTMLQGKGAMSAVRLTDQQAADVLAYLRATWP